MAALRPAAWARRHARERLGIDPDEMDGGHYIGLSRPRELADGLAAYAAGKMAQFGLMIVTAAEGEAHGVLANAISPAAATS